jgi:hypothetical protein
MLTDVLILFSPSGDVDHKKENPPPPPAIPPPVLRLNLCLACCSTYVESPGRLTQRQDGNSELISFPSR